MKRLLIAILTIALLAGAAFAITYDADYFLDQIGYYNANSKDQNPIYLFMDEVGSLLEGETGTGKFWFVDSGATGQADGTKWVDASLTVQAAITLCSADGGADRGDRIYVAQGHTITKSTTGAIFDADVAGLTIVMLGNKDNAPTFIFAHTGAKITVSDSGIRIIGGRYLAGISEVAVCFDITADADYFTLIDAVFPEPTTSSWEFNVAIQFTTAGNYAKIIGCTFYSADEAGCDSFIDGGAGVVIGYQIIGNYIYGSFDAAAIFSDQIDLELLIINNTITNLESADYCMEFTAAATGTAVGNRFQANAIGTAFDSGALSCHDNTWLDSDSSNDEEAVPVNPLVDAATNFIGVDDAANLGLTTAVTLDADGSILERLEFIQQQFQVSKSITSIDSGIDGLFTVAGGPILLIEIVTYIDVQIGAEQNLFGYNINPATGSGTVFGTDGGALDTTGIAAGTVLLWSHVMSADLTAVTNGAALSTGTAALIIPVGAIEAGLTNDGAVDGEYTVYMTYRPLAPGATVVAQ